MPVRRVFIESEDGPSRVATIFSATDFGGRIFLIPKTDVFQRAKYVFLRPALSDVAGWFPLYYRGVALIAGSNGRREFSHGSRVWPRFVRPSKDWRWA